MYGVEVIFDDIIVTATELLQRVRSGEGKVKSNTAKLQYKVSEVKYMENIVSESGLKPDAEKLRAIIEMPSPQSKEELQRFLGMVNYFSQFIPKQKLLRHCDNS